MSSVYATSSDLTARLSSAYTTPADADTLLLKASEVIFFATQGDAELVWTGDDADLKAVVTAATCDQVEYWLEVGEEHDVVALKGALMGGRLQVQKMPGIIAPRALRTLMNAGLYWAGTGIM